MSFLFSNLLESVRSCKVRRQCLMAYALSLLPFSNKSLSSGDWIVSKYQKTKDDHIFWGQGVSVKNSVFSHIRKRLPILVTNQVLWIRVTYVFHPQISCSLPIISSYQPFMEKLFVLGTPWVNLQRYFEANQRLFSSRPMDWLER